MTKEMEMWAYYAMDAIHAQAQRDPEYLALNRQQESMEESYEALLAQLPGEQRELLLRYQCCVEEMQFQKTRLAFFLGKNLSEQM